ncbi:transcription factor bHLH30 [Canna indica]|uniref:Transcription factor bHLH30 n=1 Tax=Canna indica TaxID=4628 RepID=A0AAQ3KY26_9LILI|nr:transcription factor bHLH30 [Canna indica]
MTLQEIMDAKALTASKNHSELERRCRCCKHIHAHLVRLRNLLSSTTKSEKDKHTHSCQIMEDIYTQQGHIYRSWRKEREVRRDKVCGRAASLT